MTPVWCGSFVLIPEISCFSLSNAIQDISLRIVDLLMMDRHTTTDSDTVLTIDRIFADRARLEQVITCLYRANGMASSLTLVQLQTVRLCFDTSNALL